MLTSERNVRSILWNNRSNLLCYVTDRRQIVSRELGPVVRRILRGGVDMIQFREKDLPDGDLYRLLGALRSERQGIWPLLTVNSRFDLCLVSKLDGVHLTGHSIPIPVVRKCIGDSLLIGKSVHSLQEALTARRQGADYLFFGPVFDTPSKRSWGKPQGLEKLSEVVSRVEIPVFAIGGITARNALRAFSHGARGVAAIRWFQQSKDPAGMMRRLRRRGTY